MAEHVLLIEDDEHLSAMLSEYLGARGFTVTARATATDGLKLLHQGSFAALVLDIMLPDLDGFEVCRRVRAESDIPILMLTARGDETDRIVGLELGSDDYVPKPFNPRELLARLRAILRRRGPAGIARTAPLQFGRLEIDRDARVVRVDGTERSLTSYQFELLCVLAIHAGRVMSREALMDRVRGEELDALIGELLLASRLDALEHLEHTEEINLLALLAEEGARSAAEVSGSPICIQGDPRMLRRLMRNLFENAQRYAAGSSIEASVVPLHPTGARLCIADRGPGVPEQERERIFAPFYRPTSMRERGDGGVGFGLALVRQIAQHHGGDVRCVPRHGGGTCFEVTLRTTV